MIDLVTVDLLGKLVHVQILPVPEIHLPVADHWVGQVELAILHGKLSRAGDLESRSQGLHECQQAFITDAVEHAVSVGHGRFSELWIILNNLAG